MKKLIGIATAILFTVSASAQQIESIPIQMTFGSVCNGAMFPGSNKVSYIENYFDWLLPNPLYISDAYLWTEMGATGELPAGITGNVSIAIDPGKRYITASGFPNVQDTNPQFLNTLAWLQYFAGGPLTSKMEFKTPVAYRAGQDAIVFAPECFSSPSINLATFLTLRFQNAAGLSTLSLPLVAYNTPNDGTSVNNAAISVRNLFTAQTTSLNQIRVHVFSGPLMTPFGAGPYPDASSIASHVSVCITTAPPNCISTPVELTFLGQHGHNIGPGGKLWSDWTPFPTTTAGQQLLVIEDFTSPGSINSFGYRNVAITNSWNSATAGWNAATMPGTINFQANRTIGVDGVQQQ